MNQWDALMQMIGSMGNPWADELWGKYQGGDNNWYTGALGEPPPVAPPPPVVEPPPPPAEPPPDVKPEEPKPEEKPAVTGHESKKSGPGQDIAEGKTTGGMATGDWGPVAVIDSNAPDGMQIYGNRMGTFDPQWGDLIKGLGKGIISGDPIGGAMNGLMEAIKNGTVGSKTTLGGTSNLQDYRNESSNAWDRVARESGMADLHSLGRAAETMQKNSNNEFANYDRNLNNSQLGISDPWSRAAYNSAMQGLDSMISGGMSPVGGISLSSGGGGGGSSGGWGSLSGSNLAQTSGYSSIADYAKNTGMGGGIGGGGGSTANKSSTSGSGGFTASTANLAAKAKSLASTSSGSVSKSSGPSGGGSASASNSNTGKGASPSKSGTAADCFVKGTPVTMADGTRKPIEEIMAGEKVMALIDVPQSADDPLAGPAVTLGAAEVTQTHVHDILTPLYAIEYGLESCVTVTANHPFLLCNPDGTRKGWAAIDPVAGAIHSAPSACAPLRPGDKVMGGDGTPRRISAINQIWHDVGDDDGNPTPRRVYNITVDGSHTYVAGGLVVHNK